MPALTVDLKRERKDLYRPTADAVMVVDVPTMRFLAIDGSGDPNTVPAYMQAVEALYSMAYTLKFLRKKNPDALDSPVMPLEGLWWTPEDEPFSFQRKDTWLWTALLRVPDDVTQAQFEEARASAERKKPLPALGRMRLLTWREGQAAQIMHIGPYAAEAPAIARVHAFIAERGGKLRGKHHEIYLSDPRRAAPEKLKIIIRQPFA